jgi:hypothetical protein
MAWIEKHVDRRSRLVQTPLFINPRTGTRWTHSAFHRSWERACDHAGVPRISLYEGTKHSFATDAVRRGVPERVLQRMLGHRDAASTLREAWGRRAGLRPAPAQNGDVLSPACPPGVFPEINLNNIKGLMVEAVGIEPALRLAIPGT